MTATTSYKLGTSRLFTPVVAPQTATGPPGNAAPDCDARSTGARPIRWPSVETALALGERIVFDLIRWMRDELARRQTVRELRLMDRTRLTDIGIEPDEIERVADAMLEARRNAAAGRGREMRRRFE